jgi:hypothetical protein
MTNVCNMKLSDWINFKVNPRDIWCNAVDPTGQDKDNYYIPLGCAAQPKNPELFTNNPNINSKILFYSFRLTTDNARKRFQTSLGSYEQANTRATISTILNKTYSTTPLPKDEYFDKIGEYKFVISPEGNGIDCYRHYETWLSKGIPIIQYNKFIAQKYNGLPILWTKDYSEINDNYLNKKYEEFLNKSFDFRRVLLSHYTLELQRQIINVMNTPRPSDPKAAIGSNRYWNYHDYFDNNNQANSNQYSNNQLAIIPIGRGRR